ncbi:hypothetical protein [Streptomyces cellostaticus]|uniref:hypothetical protein n=1 Tax=Streptomyces cellostaticus TaxID=67285 RepID=UPI0020264CA2|nr:hypothetical protein [Streptomyces cellostaticus]
MDAASAGVVVSLSLTLWGLVRVWTHDPPRWIDRLSLAFWGTGSVVAAERWAPGPLAAVAWVVAGFCVLGAVVAVVIQSVVPAVPVVDGRNLRRQLLLACGPDGPETTTVGVSSTGFIAVRMTGRRSRVLAARLDHGCPFCFVEEIVTDVGQDAERAVERYRGERARGVNAMAVLTRTATDLGRRADIRPMTGNRRPFPAACPVHALS